MAEYEAYDYMMFVCQNCCIYVCNGLFWWFSWDLAVSQLFIASQRSL